MQPKSDWREKRKRLDWVEKRQTLRTQAEGMLSTLASPTMVVQPAEMLMHELLVHKVELEMQVEELRRTQLELEEARDRYVDLYDFAPVGYLTIGRDGLISETNLTGATLLGIDRRKMINQRFAKFVAASDRDRWHRLFMSIMDHGEIENHVFDIEMTRADATTFSARIDCRRRAVVDAPPQLRVALLDMSKFIPTSAQRD